MSGTDGAYVQSGVTAHLARQWPYRVHTLKTVSPYFEHVYNYDKTFEVRRNDRHFLAGDLLVLAEWDGKWTGRDIAMKVIYVLRDGSHFGIEEGFVVLGLAAPRSTDYNSAARPSATTDRP